MSFVAELRQKRTHGYDEAAHIIQQTLFSRHNAVQSSLLIFDDAIWHRDQNRLHPVCIVRPKTELPQRQKERWKETVCCVCACVCAHVHVCFMCVCVCLCAHFLSSASEDGSSPILLNPSNVPLSSPQLDS